jgi:hypothetical protein
LADLIKTRCGYTKSEEEIDDIATLMMAFDSSNHNAAKKSYSGLNPAQVKIYKLVQQICYAWNWQVHDEILGNLSF